MPRKLPSVIEALYEGVLDDAAWARGLDGIADMVGSPGLLLMSCNPRSCEVFRFELPGLDSAGMREYGEHWIHQDPRYAAGLARPPGEAQVDDMLVPRAQMKRSPIYNEFLRRWDIPYCIASWVIRTHFHGVTLCIQGTKRHGHFSEEQRLKIAALLPHLRRVLQVKDRLAKAAVRADLLLETMDRLPFGVLLLSRDLSIVEASASARATLADGDGVHASGGRLGFRHASDAQAFARTLEGHRVARSVSEGIVVVRRASGRPSLTVLAMPLQEPRDEWMQPTARYLVLIFDGSRQAVPSLDVLRRNHGLTPGEARLAVGLASGSSISDIADRRSVSVQTLRSQLKSVFAKTGVRTQAQLARLVLTGAAMVIPDARGDHDASAVD